MTTHDQATQAIRTLLEFIGENLSREGLADTPDRAVRAWQEWTRGYQLDPAKILERTFGDVGDYDEMIIVRDIRVESTCEHHLAPIIGHAWVGYIPRQTDAGQVCRGRALQDPAPGGRLRAAGAGAGAHVLGGVVDVEFPPDDLPEIYQAVEVPQQGGSSLVLEVQKHLGNNWVRCVAMDSTDGLQRGVPAINTHAPIRVPVGPQTLGRSFNVLGRPVDNQGSVQADLYYPIHRPAPDFAEQSTRVEVFETGLKVVDLIAPFTKGGKTGLFGGAAG